MIVVSTCVIGWMLSQVFAAMVMSLFDYYSLPVDYVSLIIHG